jgi:hypothetical protein
VFLRMGVRAVPYDIADFLIHRYAGEIADVLV